MSLSLIRKLKNRLSVWLKFSVLALLAFTLLACGGGGDAGGSTIKVDQTVLNQTGIITGNTINRFTTKSISFTLTGGSGTGELSAISSDESIATVTLTDTTGTLNLVGDGNVTITINKAGDDQYKAAKAITIALTIEYNPTNEFSYNPGSKTFGKSQSFAINSTNFDSETEEAPAAYSLKSVSWNTLDDSTVNITTPSGISVDASTGTITVADSVNAGEYRLTVEAAFSADNTTAQAIATITVNKAPIALSFNGGTQLTFQNTVSDQNLGNNATYPLTGNIGNGAVTFALEDNTPSIGTVTPEGVFNPTEDADGSATLRVSVAATPNSLANDVDVTLLVTGKTEQSGDVLTFVTDPVTKLITDYTFFREATKEEAGVGDLSYSSSDESVATVNSLGTVTFVSAGTTTITAQLAGNETTASLNKKYKLTISKGIQSDLEYVGTKGDVPLAKGTITFELRGGYGNGAYSITSSNTNVLTVSPYSEITGRTLILKSKGSATLTINKAGDDSYFAASEIKVSFTVTKSPQAAFIYDGAQGSVGLATESIDFTLTGGGDGTGAVSIVSSNPEVFTVKPNSDSTGGTITLVGEGSATLTLSKEGDENYFATGDTRVDFVVGKSDQAALVYTGTQGKVNRTVASSIPFTLTGGNGAGAFSVSSSDQNTATITLSGTTGTVNLVGDGNVTITISKPGNAQYKAAEDLAIALIVENITLTSPLNVTPTGKLNDTGMTYSARYPSGNDTSCINTTIDALQDCNQGRDALAGVGELTKIGAGAAGFDFTKISSTGARLPSGATTWSCVLDNHTGLMWEVKTDGGLHGKNDTYTFSNAQTFVTRVNTQGLCGTKDWRMPDRDELYSIVDYSRTNPIIDTGYFPNTVSNWFWSSLLVPYDTSTVWVVSFSNGHDSLHSLGSARRVRLVRSGQ